MLPRSRSLHAGRSPALIARRAGARASIIRRVNSRIAPFAAGLAGLIAAAALVSAPYRPALAPLPADWQAASELDVTLFPAGAVYAGDRIGIAAETDADPKGRKLQVRVDRPDSSPVAEAPFFYNDRSGKWASQIPWAWDSTGKAGWHTLLVSLTVNSAGASVAEEMLRFPMLILPASLRPAQREDAVWRRAESDCCEYYFLSGTEAERDITELESLTEYAYTALYPQITGKAPERNAQTAGVPDARTESKPALVLLPRMLGQGGLTTSEVFLSYLDRDYTGTEFPVAVKHEMVHMLSAEQAGSGIPAPVFLQEGWAVYLVGGHYRAPEPLSERAAALLALGRYTPLRRLIDSFVASQHEAAYIEAGAFLEYLAVRFGQERVREMFFDAQKADRPSAMVDSTLRRHFECTLESCEEDWLQTLRSLSPPPIVESDVDFTIRLFDLIRRYQQAYVPGDSIYDLWLPDPDRARKDAITADYLSPPEPVEAVALELMFLAARRAADEGERALARETLDAVCLVLDAKARRVPDPIGVSARAANFGRLTAAVLRAGWEPLSIEFLDGGASVLVRDPAALQKEAQRWVSVRGNWALGG
jgi:hypothetical protein